MTFEQLGLSADILQALSDQGYEKPTPIQEQAIPIIMTGCDVMGAAQTGTGKTAGFTLPMLSRLQIHANTSTSPAKHPVRALILVPTRELAIQVHESVRTYGKYLALRSTVVYGGVNIDPQIEVIKSGVEILVATPGRLLDHLQQKILTLSKIEILVLDEADRMLDMGFMPDIKQIIQLLPQQRQNLMFSATFSAEIKKLAGKILQEPIMIEVAKQNSVSELITHVVHPIENSRKQELLIHLIRQKDLKQVLVFTRTKQSADKLAYRLVRHGIASTAIHGDRNQLQRTEALNSFKQGLIRVLVATDVAARGLDIEELAYVINFELPNNPEDYVHRIGRTGRAGVKGFAVSLVSKEENKQLLEVEKLLNTKICIEEVKEFEVKKEFLHASSGKNRVEEKQSKRTTGNSGKKTPVINRNNDRGLQSNNESRNAKRVGKYEDPLFTQPYVSKLDHTKVDQSAESDRDHLSKEFSCHHKRNNHFNKPIPALFVPSTAGKNK